MMRPMPFCVLGSSLAFSVSHARLCLRRAFWLAQASGPPPSSVFGCGAGRVSSAVAGRAARGFECVGVPLSGSGAQRGWECVGLGPGLHSNEFLPASPIAFLPHVRPDGTSPVPTSCRSASRTSSLEEKRSGTHITSHTHTHVAQNDTPGTHITWYTHACYLRPQSTAKAAELSWFRAATSSIRSDQIRSV